jgi:hypothetical protein
MIAFGQTVRGVCGLAGCCMVAASAWGQATGTPTMAGPGRIICKSAAACVLGLGTPATMTYHIDASALPNGDKARLTQACTDKDQPCVVTIRGTEGEDPLDVKAAAIIWHN